MVRTDPTSRFAGLKEFWFGPEKRARGKRKSIVATIANEKNANPERLRENGKPFSLHQAWQGFTKRGFDLIAALIGLALFSPFFVLLAIFIIRDSPGPALFWCLRMGKGGHPFRMLKFRTMYEEPRSYLGLPVTCKDDDRITPLGRWLRDTKINELPQLWNVLVGEMSLVGPRPEDVSIAGNWPDDLKAEILSIRPGITSPASILYRDEEDLLPPSNVMGEYFERILPDKMRLDRLYVRNRSFSSDLDLIFWTLVVIIPRMARMKIPEGYLFAGPFARLINRYISWFIIDLIIAGAVVGILGVLWRLYEPLNWGIDYLIALALLIALAFSGFNSLLGLNRIVWSRATVEDALLLAFSSLVVSILLIGLDYLNGRLLRLPLPALPVVLILTIGLMAQIGFLTVRFRWRMITALASRWLTWRENVRGVGEKVLIVGAGKEYQIANWLLRRDELRYVFSIIGVVDDEIPSFHGMRLDGSLVLGKTSDLPDLVKKYDVGVILFTTSLIPDPIKEYVFQLCQNTDVRVAFIGNLIESIQQQLTRPVTSIEHSFWSEDHLKFLAMHDYVTGLPNPFLFQDQLLRSIAYARRYNTRLVMLAISLENSKSLQEALERKSWDAAMKELSKRLLRFKRESDTLARLGELEFGLLLENISSDQDVELIAKRVSRIVSEPISVNEHSCRLSPKIILCTDLEGFSQKKIGDLRNFLDHGIGIPFNGD